MPNLSLKGVVNNPALVVAPTKVKGGTSILIVVVVAMDTVTQVQTRLMSSQYESLIKKTKFGK